MKLIEGVETSTLPRAERTNSQYTAEWNHRVVDRSQPADTERLHDVPRRQASGPDRLRGMSAGCSRSSERRRQSGWRRRSLKQPPGCRRCSGDIQPPPSPALLLRIPRAVAARARSQKSAAGPPAVAATSGAENSGKAQSKLETATEDVPSDC